MKIPRHWFVFLLLIAAAVLGARWVWTLTVSETGWRPHFGQWANAATRLVGVERRALSHKDPEQQATFWLAEVESIESTRNDPQVALGAAWMLDSPQYGFIRRHVRMNDKLNFPGIPATGTRRRSHRRTGGRIRIPLPGGVSDPN